MIDTAKNLALTAIKQSAAPRPNPRRLVDAGLLARCIDGELLAWNELYKQVYPVARAFVRRLGLNDADADDACQEVFIQVYRYLPSFEHRSELTTWLYRICASQASRVRLRAKMVAVLTRVVDEIQTIGRSHRESGQLSATESRLVVQQVLARMKWRNSLVFVLFELEEMPGDEIARILRCPLNTVWRRLHEARKEFHAVLARLERRAQ